MIGVLPFVIEVRRRISTSRCVRHLDYDDTMTVAADIDALARALPKVLLHDHLDGGLRPATLLELLRQRGLPAPAADAGALAAWFDAACARRQPGRVPARLRAHGGGDGHARRRCERVAFEAAEDVRADGCVLAEFRIAPHAVRSPRPGGRGGDRGDAAGPAAQRVAQRPDPVRDARAQRRPRPSAWRSWRGAIWGTAWSASTWPAPSSGIRRASMPARSASRATAACR